MNRIFATVSSFALLTAGAALAQSSVRMTVDIPFEFRAGKTVLPAGRYDVHPQISPGVLSLRSYEGKTYAAILTNGVGGSAVQDKGKLVFNRYGDTYFLKAVWVAGSAEGRQLPQSKAEREIARASQASKTEIAANRR